MSQPIINTLGIFLIRFKRFDPTNLEFSWCILIEKGCVEFILTLSLSYYFPILYFIHWWTFSQLFFQDLVSSDSDQLLIEPQDHLNQTRKFRAIWNEPIYQVLFSESSWITFETNNGRLQRMQCSLVCHFTIEFVW